MQTDNNPLKRFQHIVVLMLENRSFDNLLGWLYDPANQAPFNQLHSDFEGLYGNEVCNETTNGRDIKPSKSVNPQSPQPNPGEPFEHVYSQVYDQPLLQLKDVPPDPPCSPNMKGFIKNYAVQKPAPADPAKIMESLTPKTLPVLSSLAHNYAVFDHWFASIPTETLCNRSFVHAGTSSGYVNNRGGGIIFVNDTLTIFDLLEGDGKSWVIFYGGRLFESFTLLTQKRLWKYARSKHFVHFDEFLEAVKREGGLPNYSFIEPRYFDSKSFGPQNDMHPAWFFYQPYGPSNVQNAETLIWTIYDAVRNSPDWERTLLIILFDEHGGCYDHVPPPSSKEGCYIAIPPDDKIIPPGKPGGAGFKFDRLGPRVPAIVISAYTKGQTRINDVREHTSVLSTVVNCFDLPERLLGKRQAAAHDVRAAVNLPTPRPDCPSIPRPRSASPVGREEGTQSRSEGPGISDLRKAALHGVALFLGEGNLHASIDGIANEPEADNLLMKCQEKFDQAKPNELDKAKACLYGKFVQAAYTMFEHPQGGDPLRPEPAGIPDEYELSAWIHMSDFVSNFSEVKFYGIVAHSKQYPHIRVIAIRGTEGSIEWFDDFAAIPVLFRQVPNAGRVARGFDKIYNTLKVVKRRLPLAAASGAARAEAEQETFEGSFVEQLRRLAESREIERGLEPGKERRLAFVAGHSLGAALATLLVIENDEKKAFDISALYTFASPRVGTTEFVDRFNRLQLESWRIVNKHDLVPKLPLRLPGFEYDHVRTLWEFDSSNEAKKNWTCFHVLETYLHALDQNFKLSADCVPKEAGKGFWEAFIRDARDILRRFS